MLRRRDGSRGISAGRRRGAAPDRGVRDELPNRWPDAGVVVERAQTDADRFGMTRIRAEDRRPALAAKPLLPAFRRFSIRAAPPRRRRHGMFPEPGAPAPRPRHRFAADTACSGNSSPEPAGRRPHNERRHNYIRRSAGASRFSARPTRGDATSTVPARSSSRTRPACSGSRLLFRSHVRIPPICRPNRLYAPHTVDIPPVRCSCGLALPVRQCSPPQPLATDPPVRPAARGWSPLSPSGGVGCSR